MNDNMPTSYSSDRRARVLAVVLNHVASAVGPVYYTAILTNAVEALELPEEAISLEVMSATHLLCRSGLLASPSLTGDQMGFTFKTTVASSRRLTAFIHDEEYAVPDDGSETR